MSTAVIPAARLGEHLMPSMDFHRFNLEESGLTRVLGALEARIMEAVWHIGNPVGKEISVALGPGVHYKTVLTVANRLVENG